MNSLKQIFGKDRNITIGALHLPPLAGYPDHPGMDTVIELALADLKALEDGGADAVIFENNYDIPHYTTIPSSAAACMALAGRVLRDKTKLPLGVSVLWNDYQTAFSLAKLLALQFIRIPVFVDKVKTEYGLIENEADKIVACRTMLKADGIGLFADVHVKHAEILSDCDQNTSAQRALAKGADAVIITGKWTGDGPPAADVASMRAAVGDAPIFVGSGVDVNNAPALYAHANGAIISTSLKESLGATHAQNVHSYQARIMTDKVRALVQAADLGAGYGLKAG